MLSCPTHPDVELEPKKRGWYCDECGMVVASFESVPAPTPTPASSVALAIEAWPHVVAVPVAAAVGETHPVIQLHRLCDAVEILVRYLTVLRMAQLRDPAGWSALPESARTFLQASIRRPTLGVWSRLLNELTRGDSGTDPICAFAQDHLLPLLFGVQEGRGRAESLLEVRNQLVHSGAIRTQSAVATLAIWRPRFDALILAAAFLSGHELIYSNSETSLKLVGTSGRPVVYLEPELLRAELSAKNGHVVVIVAGAVLDLWPLCAFVPSSAPGSPEGAERKLFVYYRSEDERLLYAVLDGTPSVDELRGGYADFARLFRLGESVSPTLAAADFEQELRADSLALVGRAADLALAKATLRIAQQGVFWLSGPGGIGKSLFAARLAEDLRGDPRKGLCVAWRFRAGDPRCTRGAFLRHSVARVAAWLRLTSPRDLATMAPGPLEQALRDLLGFVAQGASNGSVRAPKLLFVIDGLDEIIPTDGDFPRLPFQLSMPNVIWVCVGRAEGDLPVIFDGGVCTALLPGGLPPMGPDDIRGMLLDQPGEPKYGLLRRDQGALDENVQNAFVDAVVANAHGLPLYVRCVLDDILSGDYGFQDETRLPRGLLDYYKRALSRLSVGDLQSVVTPIVVLLAIVESPVDSSFLIEFLTTTRRVVAGARGQALVERGLLALQSLIRPAPTASGSLGLTLVHETLREYVTQNSAVEQQREMCLTDLSELAAAGPRVPDGALRSYLLLFGPIHLARCHRFGDILSVCAAAELRPGVVLLLDRDLQGSGASILLLGLVNEAKELGTGWILEAILPALEAAISAGRYARVSACLDPVEDLCSTNGVKNEQGVVVVAFLRAWLERAQGRLTSAIRLFESIDLEQAGRYRARIQYEHANAIREFGGFDRARPMYKRLYEAAGGDGTPGSEYVTFTQQYADIIYVQGQHRTAISILRKAERDFAVADYPGAIAEVLRIQGHVLRMSERADDATRIYIRAAELFTTVNHSFGLARIETNLAEALALTRPQQAAEHAKRAITLNGQLGAPLEVGKATNALGLATLAVGDLDEAKRLFDEAAAIQSRVGHRAGGAMVTANLVHWHLRRGDPGGARHSLSTLANLLSNLNAYPFVVYRCARMWSLAAGRDPYVARLLDRLGPEVEWMDGQSAFDTRVDFLYGPG